MMPSREFLFVMHADLKLLFSDNITSPSRAEPSRDSSITSPSRVETFKKYYRAEMMLF